MEYTESWVCLMVSTRHCFGMEKRETVQSSPDARVFANLVHNKQVILVELSVLKVDRSPSMMENTSPFQAEQTTRATNKALRTFFVFTHPLITPTIPNELFGAISQD